MTNPTSAPVGQLETPLSLMTPICDHCGEAEGTVELGPLLYCQGCYQAAVDDYATVLGLTAKAQS